ncbi:MAG: thioredoxin family protein [Fusobacterium sp.]|nr:thioredoxin family protein [Fusobacterium sp.]
MKKTLLIVCMIFALPVIAYALLNANQPAPSEVAVAATGMPQMIKFSSPMCSDCQHMAEILHQVQPQYQDKVEFVEISVNQSSPQVKEQIRRYNVKLVPTMVFLNSNGQQIARVEGSIPKEELVKYLDEGLKQ